MCSVTWWRGDAGAYGVCFNRDEQRARPPSLPVALNDTAGDVSFLAPRDSAAGGTWLIANAHGLVAGVLNHYVAAGLLPPGWRSRGELPLMFAECADCASAATVAGAIAWAAYAPCIIVVWDATGECGWVWDGVKLASLETLPLPLTTSSHRTRDVCAWRAARFQELLNAAGERKPTAALCHAFQHDASHGDGAFNVRMRRPDARTESLCRIEVTPRDVRFVHQREQPDALAALDIHEAHLART